MISLVEHLKAENIFEVKEIPIDKDLAEKELAELRSYLEDFVKMSKAKQEKTWEESKKNKVWGPWGFDAAPKYNHRELFWMGKRFKLPHLNAYIGHQLSVTQFCLGKQNKKNIKRGYGNGALTIGFAMVRTGGGSIYNYIHGAFIRVFDKEVCNSFGDTVEKYILPWLQDIEHYKMFIEKFSLGVKEHRNIFDAGVNYPERLPELLPK